MNFPGGQWRARRLRLFLVEPILEHEEARRRLVHPRLSSSAPWLTWDWTPEIAAADLKEAVPAGHRLTCVRALDTGASKVAAIWTQDDSGRSGTGVRRITFDDCTSPARHEEPARQPGQSRQWSELCGSAPHGSTTPAPSSPRTWFWFAGAKETYLRGQSDGLCSHPVELCNLGGGNLAAILNRTPAPGTPADDVLLEVTGTATVEAFNATMRR